MKKNRPALKTRIRILIADDHPVVREGLVALINRSPDMKVIGEAVDGKQAVPKFLEHQPDVLLLDLRMPKLDGIAVIRAIFQRAPNAKVIMLSTYKGDEDVYQALKAGAKAYLLKDSPREELLEAIRSVFRGQVKVSPAAAAGLAAGFGHARLTRRETEIMQLMVAGKINKEIAVVLGSTEGTVKVHVGHILKKLGASGRTEAIRIALQRGIVHIGPV
jgi:two-component system, NarL family, response regulator